MAVLVEFPDHGCEHIDQSISVMLQKHKQRSKPGTFSTQYSCLECSAVCELQEFDKHFKKTKHSFASAADVLYCGQCKDIVYEPVSTQRNTKKRKLADVADDDDTYLSSNTSQRPCGREGVRGLFNLGETCYMNAVLQTMVHNPLLSSYFLGMGHPTHTCPSSNQPEKKADSDSSDDELNSSQANSKSEPKPCIACGFTELFAESRMHDQTIPAHAVNLLYASWKCIPTMSGKQQQDSQEWYTEIVDKLHETIKPSPLDSSGLCTCFFHQIFFGRLTSEVTCDTCHTVSSTSEPFSSISLDFKKQKKMKKKALNLTNTKSTTDPKSPVAPTIIPNIAECLQSYTTAEPLPSDSYTCQTCSAPRPAQKRLRIHKLPAVLCIHVKRFGMRAPTNGSSAYIEEKYEGKIHFPLSVDMAPYTITTESTTRGEKKNKKKKETMYDLDSVIVHQGELMQNGHYYSFCRQDGRWYKFDDEIVSATTVEEVLRQEAYLLFYALRR